MRPRCVRVRVSLLGCGFGFMEWGVFVFHTQGTVVLEETNWTWAHGVSLLNHNEIFGIVALSMFRLDTPLAVAKSTQQCSFRTIHVWNSCMCVHLPHL